MGILNGILEQGIFAELKSHWHQNCAGLVGTESTRVGDAVCKT